MIQIHVSAVANPAGGIWIVQGSEYDIHARAAGPENAQRIMVAAVRERTGIDRCLGRTLFDGVKSAPPPLAETSAMATPAAKVHDAKSDQ